ncbi:hypothetical protein [Altererythrobacter sp. MF3-039]|uniref:hypothetical protein n=1 Tax=Altererythrobacter sp. MF3-039 TaxID=3252901 RepID=UPI00390C4A04
MKSIVLVAIEMLKNGGSEAGERWHKTKAVVVDKQSAPRENIERRGTMTLRYADQSGGEHINRVVVQFSNRKFDDLAIGETIQLGVCVTDPLIIYVLGMTIENTEKCAVTQYETSLGERNDER